MTSTCNPEVKSCNHRPIGYVVMLKLTNSDSWEPAALTKCDDEPKHLLVRSCFSMFPSEVEAERALRALQGKPWVRGVEARISAVFPANIAAPHTKAEVQQ